MEREEARWREEIKRDETRQRDDREFGQQELLVR